MCSHGNGQCGIYSQTSYIYTSYNNIYSPVRECKEGGRGRLEGEEGWNNKSSQSIFSSLTAWSYGACDQSIKPLWSCDHPVHQADVVM